MDKVVLFIAPMLMTGRDSLCSIGGTSPRKLSGAIRVRGAETRVVGQDQMIEGYIEAKEVKSARRKANSR